MDRTRPYRRRTALAALAVAAGALLAACGSSTGSGSSAATTVASSPNGTSNIEIMGAWARTSAASQEAGAAYLTIENTGTKADALTKAAVPATVAATAEVHETVGADAAMTGTTAMGGAATTGMGAMTMRPVDRIVVPARGKVELKPGGYHIMLMKLAKPLEKGSSFDLTLTFESGTTRTVKVEVRDQA